MDFDEVATSNPNQKIHFYVYMYNGILNGESSTSKEIEWYESNNEDVVLSNTLKNEVIPHCLKNV